MTPEQLKASILQYAIQGMLVEQRPEEGTGEELYRQIQAEKQRLIKEGKIKKEKPLAEITEDELPFDIPESWKWYRIGELFNIVNGFTPLKSNPEFWTDGDIPWFTIEDVRRQGRFISSTEKFITRKALAKNTERIVPADTVLLCCTASVGEYAYAKIPLTTNQQFNAFVVKDYYKNAVYPLYVFEYAKTLKGSLIDRAGKTTFNFVSVGKLSNMLIPLPPLAEQKRIVDKIEELLPYVDRYAAAYEKLEQFNAKFPEDMKKSILQYAIQGKLVEQRPEEGTGEELYRQIQKEKQLLIKEGKIKKEKSLAEIAEDEKPFDIPESWKSVRLGNIVSVYGGKRIPVGRKLSSEDTGYIYIRVSDMKDGYVSIDNLQYVPQDIYPLISRYIINKEDVFITVAGTIGRVGKIPPELDGANLTENADRLVFSNLDQDWLIKCLQSPLIQSQIADATTKVGQPKLAIIRIQNIIIPLPPLAEQKRIVAKLEEILPLCERLK